MRVRAHVSTATDLLTLAALAAILAPVAAASAAIAYLTTPHGR